MFGFVSIQGMQILARVDFEHNENNFLIAAVSIAAGVGLNNSTSLQRPSNRIPNVLCERNCRCQCLRDRSQCYFKPQTNTNLT